MWSIIIQLILDFFFAFITIITIIILRISFPEIYFSVGQLIVTSDKDITVSGLFVKFLPPLIYSFFLTFFVESFAYIALYGFLASFLVVWPVILTGNDLLSEDARKKKGTLYFIYFLYILL